MRRRKVTAWEGRSVNMVWYRAKVMIMAIRRMDATTFAAAAADAVPAARKCAGEENAGEAKML